MLHECAHSTLIGLCIYRRREALAHLSFITDNYQALSDVTIFAQDDNEGHPLRLVDDVLKVGVGRFGFGARPTRDSTVWPALRWGSGTDYRLAHGQWLQEQVQYRGTLARHHAQGHLYPPLTLPTRF